MGKITSIKTLGEERVLLTIEVTNNEFLWLQGNLNNVHVFSINNLNHKTRLVKRGVRESSKYLLLPKNFRNLVPISQEVKTDYIERKNNVLMIFSIPRY